MEGMLQKMVDYGDIITGDGEKSSFNNRLDYITNRCEEYENEKGKKVILYDRPLFPNEKCSKEIKYVLDFLGNITNNNSHFLKDDPTYLRKDEASLEYNILLQKSIYPAFFLAMKWYYGFMTKYHPRTS